MKLTLLDYDRKTLASKDAYGTVELQPDGSLIYGGSDAKRAAVAVTNARDAVIRAGNRTPTNEQVLTWLATKSAKAKNGRVTRS